MVGRVEMRRQGWDEVRDFPRLPLLWIGGEVLLSPLRQGGLPAQLQLKTPVWPQDLHALITPISHVDITLGVHRDTRRPVELALALSGRTKAGHELSIGGEFLNAVV